MSSVNIEMTKFVLSNLVKETILFKTNLFIIKLYVHISWIRLIGHVTYGLQKHLMARANPEWGNDDCFML